MHRSKIQIFKFVNHIYYLLVFLLWSFAMEHAAGRINTENTSLSALNELTCVRTALLWDQSSSTWSRYLLIH